MATSTIQPANTRLFVLALGLLVGFVIGFILLLSSLPVDSSLSDYHATQVDNPRYQPKQAQSEQRFEFYTVLADHIDQPSMAVQDVTSTQPVIPPATRVVPGNAQNLNQRNLAAEDYAEIPASSIGQESYYLQAGNYHQPSEAERMRAVVLLLGLEAFIVTRQDASGATGHRVRIGPFFDQNRLTNAKKRLRRGNVPYDIIRVTG